MVLGLGLGFERLLSEVIGVMNSRLGLGLGLGLTLTLTLTLSLTEVIGVMKSRL